MTITDGIDLGVTSMQIFEKTIASVFLLILLIGGSVTVSQAETNTDKKFGYSDRYGKVTPSQVFAILKNYESMFSYYINNHYKDKISLLNSLELIPVTGKKPEDVFVNVNKLSDLIDQLAVKFHMQAMPRISRENNIAIPAEVFLQSGHILDAFTNIMVQLEPNNAWGNFYKMRADITGKNPNHVYALSDLSKRKFELVLQLEKQL